MSQIRNVEFDDARVFGEYGAMVYHGIATYRVNSEGKIVGLLLDDIEELDFEVEDYRTVLDGGLILTLGSYDVEKKLRD